LLPVPIAPVNVAILLLQLIGNLIFLCESEIVH
jgi:hypothetical protein